MGEVSRTPSAAEGKRSAGGDPVALFIENILCLNNGGIEEVGKYLAQQSAATRARFVERCSSLIGTAAELDASKGGM